MHAELDATHAVITQYAILGSHLQSAALAKRGFSGAGLWKIRAGAREYCLRRWPSEHPTLERLEFIHAVIRHAAASGISYLPVPLHDRKNRSIVESDAQLWELTPWLPGVANYHADPSWEKLQSAMRALANFHLAAATCCLARVSTSPGLSERRTYLHQLEHGGLERLAAQIDERQWPAMARLAKMFIPTAEQILDHVRSRLAIASTWTVPLQPCIRDVWHDHLLFTGDQITGIVDFGAMRIESVAGDLARCLGSLVGDDSSARQTALDAYESYRPLSDLERQLIPVFDESAVLLGGINWIRWIYAERRHFADCRTIEQRMEELLARARVLAIRTPLGRGLRLL